MLHRCRKVCCLVHCIQALLPVFPLTWHYFLKGFWWCHCEEDQSGTDNWRVWWASNSWSMQHDCGKARWLSNWTGPLVTWVRALILSSFLSFPWEIEVGISWCLKFNLGVGLNVTLKLFDTLFWGDKHGFSCMKCVPNIRRLNGSVLIYTGIFTCEGFWIWDWSIFFRFVFLDV